MEDLAHKKQFAYLIAGIKSAYPSFKLNDKEQIRFWYACLKDLNITKLEQAVQLHIQNSKFPPTISELRELCQTKQETLDAGEAWQKVLSAIALYGRSQGGKALLSFDDVTAACVKRLGWEQLCNSTNQMVDRAHFIKMFDKAQEREKKQLLLNESNKNLIGGVF